MSFRPKPFVTKDDNSSALKRQTPSNPRIWPTTRPRLARVALRSIWRRRFPNQKTPQLGGACGATDVYLLMVNCPRFTFLNRESLPLVFISLSIAEYRVAEGVLPPGDFQ